MMIMRYYNVLKQLFPVPDMTGVLDPDLSLEGKYLDISDSSAQAQIDQLFPSTSDSSALDDWLFFTDTTDQSSCLSVFTDFKKRDGWMNPDYYTGLCNKYGLDATVYEGLDDMFILGPVVPPASALPHAIYDQTHAWTWRVDTAGAIDSTSKSILTEKIITRAPAWTQVSFSGTIA